MYWIILSTPVALLAKPNLSLFPCLSLVCLAFSRARSLVSRDKLNLVSNHVMSAPIEMPVLAADKPNSVAFFLFSGGGQAARKRFCYRDENKEGSCDPRFFFLTFVFIEIC